MYLCCILWCRADNEKLAAEKATVTRDRDSLSRQLNKATADHAKEKLKSERLENMAKKVVMQVKKEKNGQIENLKKVRVWTEVKFRISLARERDHVSRELNKATVDHAKEKLKSELLENISKKVVRQVKNQKTSRIKDLEKNGCLRVFQSAAVFGEPLL